MKKVIIVCTQLEAGGAQRAAIRLAEYFRDTGLDCENWFLYKKRDVFNDVPNIKVIYPSPVNSAKEMLSLLKTLFLELRRNNPDVVITFGHNSNILTQLVAFLAGISTRVASHRNPRWGYMSKIQQKIDLVWASVGIYSKITAVSSSTKSSFTNYPARVFRNIKVIENGLTFKKVVESMADSRKTLSLPLDKFLIGNIGRLSYQKNHELLITSLSKLESNIELVIVGEGEMREELETLANKLNVSDRVHFLGEIKFDLIPTFLNSIDVYTMPSRFEGLSNALVEAMSAGKPVIASNVDSQKDVVLDESNKLNGILLSIEDEGGWVSSIKEFVNNPELLKKYSELALARASDFEMSKMGNRFLETLGD